MDIEGLIENLKALSDILKSKPIRESVSLNDFKNSYDRFEAAVSDLRVVSKQSVQRDSTKLRSILENLQKTISELDELIDKYWDLRNSNKITEDCGNNNPLSPFKNHKEILRPYLEYFCFKGTGSSDSKQPAESVIKFYKFDDPSTWKIYSKRETVDEIWDGLYFCMRDIGKGGVKDYKNSPDIKILSPWTRYSTKKYRGALSVRYKSK